jgi:hypothetical protein
MLPGNAQARGLVAQLERYAAPNVDNWIDG